MSLCDTCERPPGQHPCARCCWQPDPEAGVSDREQLVQHADDWVHPLCSICTRSLPEQQGAACDRCLDRTRADLAGIELMYDELPQHLSLMLSGTYDRGSRAAADGRPLPGGDVLVLLGKGSEGLAEDGTTTKDRDPMSVAYELGWWEKDWRQRRDEAEAEGRPRSARAEVRDAVRYLEVHARWAATAHPGFDQYAADLRRLHRRLEDSTGRSARRHVAEAECFDCGGDLERKLTDHGYADQWTCSRCGRVYAWERYLLALQMHLRANPAQGWSLPEHVGLTLGVRAQRVRNWADRQRVASACVVGDPRLRVWYPEVAELVERIREKERKAAERAAKKLAEAEQDAGHADAAEAS